MSISLRRFSIAPTSTEASDNHYRNVRRVHFSPDILKAYKLCTADIIAVAGENISISKEFALGVVWPSTELSQDSVVIPNSLLLTARLKPGQYCHVFPLSGAASANLPPEVPSLRWAKEAATIRLKQLSIPKSSDMCIESKSSRVHDTRRQDWLSLLLREHLVSLKYITNRQVIEVSYEGQKRHFALTSITSKGSAAPDSVGSITRQLESLAFDADVAPEIWVVTWDVVVSTTDAEPEQETPLSHQPEIEILQPTTDAYSSVGGLEKQIAEIRDLLELPLTRPDLFRYFGLKPPRGILLYGPPGTGKTHLARVIASSTRSSVLVINGPELSSAYHGETESKLRGVFKQAREKSPCIVILDEVDALAPRREDEAGGEVEKRVVATLLTVLDGMEDGEEQGRVVVIGTTNRPNAIDPALRRPGRFDREIEIGVPDAQARLSILKVLLAKTPYDISEEDLQTFASRAHGYVGADLAAIVREAGTMAIKKWMRISKDDSALHPKLTIDELMASLTTVRPSAMRSLFIEMPRIRYSDIGGQADVIQKLREVIEWPLLHPEAFKRLGVKAPKGLLLYGPPGCSKTILARACACESGINFVAVKGPELLNKYVGESERGVREMFRKARQAAPSIIFFDEIDALATSRSKSDTETVSHGGVLTTLLNEMDGVQELLGVTIIAATNRPEVIDSALMRPGRLDRILYVGPPDQAGREEILRIKIKNMSVGKDIDISLLAELCNGCSGAEITAMCQEAAILEMKKNINAPSVSQDSFLTAARSMQRQITPAVLEKFIRWRDDAELKSL